MTREEWNREFYRLNGRYATAEEMAAAQVDLLPSEVDGSAAARFNHKTLLKVAAVLLVAIFGYVVGFLFA